jgi:hypothetical protein
MITSPVKIGAGSMAHGVRNDVIRLYARSVFRYGQDSPVSRHQSMTAAPDGAGT